MNSLVLMFVAGFVAGSLATWATLRAREFALVQKHERRLAEARAEVAEARALADEARSKSLAQLHVQLSLQHQAGPRSRS